MIHTVKGFGIINETEVEGFVFCFLFLEFPSFLYDPANVGNLISGSSSSSKPTGLAHKNSPLRHSFSFSPSGILKFPIMASEKNISGPVS